MSIEKVCLWCGDLFTPNHGNDNYCCREHQEEAKKDRQKQKRDPIKKLIPILMANHEILDNLVIQGKSELTADEVEAYHLDISLCRHLKTQGEHIVKLMLDFGTYYLITETDFLIFKIHKHATTNAL